MFQLCSVVVGKGLGRSGIVIDVQSFLEPSAANLWSSAAESEFTARREEKAKGERRTCLAQHDDPPRTPLCALKQTSGWAGSWTRSFSRSHGAIGAHMGGCDVAICTRPLNYVYILGNAVVDKVKSSFSIFEARTSAPRPLHDKSWVRQGGLTSAVVSPGGRRLGASGSALFPAFPPFCVSNSPDILHLR